MQQFLQQSFLENTVQHWAKFMVLLLIAFLFKKYISMLLGTILYQPFRKFSIENEGKKFVSLLSKPIEFLILFITIFYAFKSLKYPTLLEVNIEEFDLKFILNSIFKTIGAIAITWFLMRIIDFMSFVFYQKYSSHESVVDEQIVPFVKDSAKVILGIISLVLILSLIYKLNVASIIAGIGIGGLAVALAAKESLENLLGSFTIFLDKPFHVGDMVQVGSVIGTVEKVGFRSTRIRTESKTFVTVPNKQIVDSMLDNITERTHRRMEIKLHLLQNTTPLQLKNVSQKIKTVLAATEMIENDYVVIFNAITAASYEMQIIYLVKQCDIALFNEIKQQINYQILSVLETEQVQLANIKELLVAELGKK